MALRYLALVGSAASTASPPAPPPRNELKAVYRSTTLVVYATEPGLPLADGAGIILGQLFKGRRPARRVSQLSPAAAEDIKRTQGGALITEYWGGYVALLSSEAGDLALRDPSGVLPCYCAQVPNGWIVASDIDLLRSALASRPIVNPEALLRHLAATEFRRAETCLTQVIELLAGFRLQLDVTGASAALWSPWDHVHPANRSPEDSAVHLRATIDDAVSAWGDCFSAMGVSLSGGLDSSIVTAALLPHADRLTLLNLAGADAESDERAYAGLAGQAVGVNITERFYDQADVDFQTSASAHLPRPVMSALANADLAVKRRLEAEHGLMAWFGGLGGDNVFCFMQSATPVLDRLQASGIGPGALKTLGDVMTLTGCTLWEALAQMGQTHHRIKGQYPIIPETRFLNPDRFLAADQPFEHPWRTAPLGTPIGKIVHVAMLLRIQGSNDGFERSGAPLITPLLSQPIMEACLAVPTWLWCYGGRNRAMARLAYRGLLPDALLDRRSKGGPSRFAYAAVSAHRTELADLLLGGCLAGIGLLDRPVLETVLKGAQPLAADTYVRIAQLAEAEVWARHWS